MRGPISLIPRVFSSGAEESLRLRGLTLAAFWVAALSVAWVGGSPWTWLGGGMAATAGHAISWHRRDRSMGIWPLVMVALVVALALVMRTEVLAVFQGNWLPLAHYLLLVQAIAAFDARTRGGLYGGLALSAIVLFFASQQAFGLSFGVFLLAYSGVLLAFLSTAYLEDESRAARSGSTSGRNPLLGFWSATGVAVLVFSALAFLLLPRGESNALGYQDVSALPITGESGGPQAQAAAQSLPAGATPSGTGQPQVPGGGPLSASKGGSPGSLGTSGAGTGPETPQERGNAGAGPGPGAQDVIMRVRSPVASYWRGLAFDTFDGTTWHPDLRPARGPMPRDPRRYAQTFYMNEGGPGPLFTGYRAVEVVPQMDGIYGGSLGEGRTYQVLSVKPGLDPEALRRDRPARAPERYYSLTDSADWLPELAKTITAGAETGFDKAASIVAYLRQNTAYDNQAPNHLASSTSLEGLLLDGKEGTSLDNATAAVLLARASGLPARLAAGYLPGERDLLSGAYEVRREHAHVWSEVLFREHGWVPLDGTPRPDAYSSGPGFAGGQLAGLKYLFESSVGDDLLRAAAQAPSRLSDGLSSAMNSPAMVGMVAVASGAFLAGLSWLATRLLWKGRRSPRKRWSYSRLSGAGRHDMLRIYRRVERTLKKRGVLPRAPAQTLGEYADGASQGPPAGEAASEHLAWFTEAARAAAYDPSGFSPATVQEARLRLTALKAALG